MGRCSHNGTTHNLTSPLRHPHSARTKTRRRVSPRAILQASRSANVQNATLRVRVSRRKSGTRMRMRKTKNQKKRTSTRTRTRTRISRNASDSGSASFARRTCSRVTILPNMSKHAAHVTPHLPTSQVKVERAANLEDCHDSAVGD